MQSIHETLTQYAAYHRDRRNIATHFVGVPLIVFSVVLALNTVTFPFGSIVVPLAVLTTAAAIVYYVALDKMLGITMAVILLLMCAGASEITARESIPQSLGWALGIFVVGWALQYWGHYFEGMKPAFYDDVKQLLIGPLFVLAEAFFLFGAKPELRRYIEDRVGPTVARRSDGTSPTA
ncbi:hypothetical protein DSM104443_00998 [Usitatibacter rugosus]|uniref:Membrane protein YGL010W n=1 Tax=Usitatibacter rugosus TaxID=2732067 RepID=A0A6M4GWE3_9PROT|nr:Mpo1-like protein [Usitatibacter rugosus]QJR09947.1 hypothetical protein DSM104443_00998 [Usitatibacter rugosus]